MLYLLHHKLWKFSLLANWDINFSQTCMNTGDCSLRKFHHMQVLINWKQRGTVSRSQSPSVWLFSFNILPVNYSYLDIFGCCTLFLKLRKTLESNVVPAPCLPHGKTLEAVSWEQSWGPFPLSLFTQDHYYILFNILYLIIIVLYIWSDFFFCIF